MKITETTSAGNIYPKTEEKKRFMRQIKFRAWDKPNNRMMANLSNEDFFKVADNSGNLIVMQYTGINDKQDDYIYEGDVLRDTFGQHVLIVWNNTDARFEAIYTNTGYSGSRHIIDIKHMEIIGNRYQNPELIGRIKV